MTKSFAFAFGLNWQSFAQDIGVKQIDQATQALHDLVGGDLIGKSFLDIGCGSGLSMLAAVNLGANYVRGIDLDAVAVETANSLIERWASKANARALWQSIVGPLLPDGRYDVVHAWGSLHHTGDMWLALGRSVRCVKPGGLLILALYRRTRLCWAWRMEKRWYSRAPAWQQCAARAVYKAPFHLLGRPAMRRGMNWDHDVHDWLGGYPYESTTPAEVSDRLRRLGFDIERISSTKRRLGLAGTGCDEYVARRS